MLLLLRAGLRPSIVIGQFTNYSGLEGTFMRSRICAGLEGTKVQR
jgi:hypothetical protein